MSDDASGTTQTDTTNGGATRADELKARLGRHIDAAREKLEELKNDLSSLHEQDRESLRLKSAEIHRRVDQQKERAKQMRDDILSWQREKVEHTQEAVASWRQRREVQKLQSRADRAEEYAKRAVVIAALDFEEAEQALLDAVTARFDAEIAAAP